MSLQEARINLYSIGIVTDIIIIRPSPRLSVRQKNQSLLQGRPSTKERMCHQEHLLVALYKLACTAIVTRCPSKGRNNYFFGYQKDMIKVTFCKNSYRKYTTVLVFRVHTAYQNTMIENWQKCGVSQITSDSESVSVCGK